MKSLQTSDGNSRGFFEYQVVGHGMGAQRIENGRIAIFFLAGAVLGEVKRCFSILGAEREGEGMEPLLVSQPLYQPCVGRRIRLEGEDLIAGVQQRFRYFTDVRTDIDGFTKRQIR